MNEILTPEQKLRNVANLVLKYTTVSRQHNGKGKAPSYSEDKHVIAEAARQLAEDVLVYLDGEAKPSIVDDIPF